jgi:hypothetical protein
MANEFGSLSLLTKCVEAVAGINAQSYSAETTVEEVLVTDECGENAKLMTKNVTSNHEWEGQILGASASGIAAAKVGASFAAPSGMWLENMNNPGSANVLTSGRAQFNAGEYATFMGRITNREGI